jgi:hypothetical protein
MKISAEFGWFPPLQDCRAFLRIRHAYSLFLQSHQIDAGIEIGVVV